MQTRLKCSDKEANEMQFEKLVQLRYSVRKFDARPVDAKKVQTILRAAQVAPSGKNKQGWRVLVLNERSTLEKLKGCTVCHYHAPLVFVICADPTNCYVREADGASVAEIDAAIAATHMMLQACELGVGSTWVENFDPTALRECYHIPEPLKPMALLVCGYPHTDAVVSPRHRERKPLEELCVYNSFEPNKNSDRGEEGHE